MKVLVVFYSRSGHTRKLAQEIASRMGADIEEIQENKSRAGLWGWLMAGYEASHKKLAVIAPPQKDPKQYDLVVIGTPVWASTMSCATRTYLTQKRNELPQTAFFCSLGGDQPQATFAEMRSLAGKAPRAQLALREAKLTATQFGSQVEAFVKELGR
jgi:flavodoxin